MSGMGGGAETGGVFESPPGSVFVANKPGGGKAPGGSIGGKPGGGIPGGKPK